MPEATVRIIVQCRALPGRRFADTDRTYEPVYLGIQRGKETVDLVPGDAASATFTPEFRVTRQKDGSPNFLGPYAQGAPQDRFFYLVWSVKNADGELEMFRRLKIRLGHLTWKDIERDSPLEVRLRLTDAKGCPLCATPPASHIEWWV